MAIMSGQIAFEIDEEARIATFVFLGPVTDQQALDLYRSGGIDAAAVAGFDFLFDLRHTKWIPQASTVRALALHIRQVRLQAGAGPDRRLIAAVRRDRPEVYLATHGVVAQQELGSDRLGYFNDVDSARAWFKTALRPVRANSDGG